MKTEKKYVIVSVITLSILLFGVSYSYFKAKIVGTPTDIGLTAKEVYLKFNGSADLVTSTIVPGWSTTKTFTIQNESKKEEKYNIVIEDLVNTFVTSGYLQYKITSTNGYNMTEYKDISKINTPSLAILAYNVSIPASTTQNYTIELIYRDTTEDQSADMGKTLSGKLNIKEGTTIPYEENTLAYKVVEDNSVITERTSFDVTNVANTTGSVYKTNKTEDGSTVYYYSGNTTNNWVNFGGFYWRIIRTNIDGSVRLLYSGTSTDTTSGYINSSTKFNSTYNESRYTGYMYGGNTSLADNRTNTTSSTIKGVIDTWYQNNLLESYDKYISKSAIYCNDRSVGSGDWVNTGGSDFYYGAYTRLNTNKAPNYKCGANASNGLFESTQATADKFSVNTTGGGNGQLTYPIALMTADEIAFAGGVAGEELSSPYAWYYLNSAGGSITGFEYWWLLSPYYWYSFGYSYVFVVCDSIYPGGLKADFLLDYHAVRPVISIDQCTKFTGTGTPTDPYVVDTTNSTCN